ncbi:MAG TPA: hypothetical protein VFX44_04080 [Solirubrobacterales bacterium]|nr:hypothetical protein [Solirubrobacterales bacterium]
MPSIVTEAISPPFSVPMEVFLVWKMQWVSRHSNVVSVPLETTLPLLSTDQVPLVRTLAPQLHSPRLKLVSAIETFVLSPPALLTSPLIADWEHLISPNPVVKANFVPDFKLASTDVPLA